MSNYLAIATVTAVLQQILQETVETDLPGAQVTTVRPDKKQGVDLDKPGINLYLYQVSPNPAWRNSDLRTRRPKGDLSKQRQAGLDLHYLLTFYGDERELIPQRLLGSAVRSLVDLPVLDPDTLRRYTRRSQMLASSYSYLADSDLADQVQRVRLMPSNITTEDLSRIWSVFFQTPYSLSLAYQGTVILIEGDRPGEKGLPLRRPPSISVAPQIPKIESVAFLEPGGELTPLERIANQIVARGTLVVKGQQLLGDRTYLQIGQALLTPHQISDGELQLDLDNLNTTEAEGIQAGVAGLKVVQTQSIADSRVSQRRVSSNVVPLAICPTVTANGTLELEDIDEDEYDLYSGVLTVSLDVWVENNQQAFVLLNSLETEKAYVFRQISSSRRTREPQFQIEGIVAGEYLVRVQVDGAESRLNINPATDLYDSPKLVVS